MRTHAEGSAKMLPISPSGLAEQATALHEPLTTAFDRVLASGWFVLGREVSAFEEEFAAWIGAAHGAGVNSGTDALTLALQAFDVGPGDEVIIPSNALPTAYGVHATGARIRFCDVRDDDYNLDPVDVRAQITSATSAIVAVHLYGHPAALDDLAQIAREHNVVLIEDCAQAHGAAIGDARVGSIGDAAAFSFYPTKNLGAIGDGGMVVTSNQDAAERVKRLRMYGEARRYHSEEVGQNSRLDELQAAFLRVKLPLLDGFLERRRAIAARYNDLLVDIVRVPPQLAGMTHARHLYPVALEERDAVAAAMVARGVPVGIHYPVGAHEQPCFAELRDRALPVTERLSQTLMSLPIHPELNDDQVNYIAAALRDVIDR